MKNFKLFKKFTLYFGLTIITMFVSVGIDCFELFLVSLCLCALFLFLSIIFLIVSTIEKITSKNKKGDNLKNIEIKKLKQDLIDLKSEENLIKQKISFIRNEIRNLVDINHVTFTSSYKSSKFCAVTINKLDFTVEYENIYLPISSIIDLDLDIRTEFVSSSNYRSNDRSDYYTKDNSIYVGTNHILVGSGKSSTKGYNSCSSNYESISSELKFYDVIVTTNIISSPVIIIECGDDKKLALSILNALKVSLKQKPDIDTLNRLHMMRENEKELNKIKYDIDKRIENKKLEIKNKKKEL